MSQPAARSYGIARRWLGAVGICGATIVVGILLGYHGYGGHFRTNNPALDERLTRGLSVCRS